MPRFFVAPEQVHGDKITIKDAEARHITKVLRLGPGDIITVLDGRGFLYESRIDKKDKDIVYCKVLHRDKAGGEPPLRVVLVQGIAKGDRMDTVIQKGTELGASAFLPVHCHRSVVQMDKKKGTSRRERWQRIAAEAAKQCRRGRVPDVLEPVSWRDALELIPPKAAILIPWEEASARTLKEELQALSKPEEIYIMIGPEGGLERQEVDEAIRRGGIPVTLGPRILRTETAGPATITMVLYHWGDLGGNL